MGPSGVGKTTVGKILAKKLDCDFLDGDDYHPQINIKKMRQGIPLDDDDRKPWLKALVGEINIAINRQKNMVLACSALKEKYRKILNVNSKEIKTVFLVSSYSILKARLDKRAGHFAKTDLLKSQLDIQEIPKTGLVIDANNSLEKIVEKILI